MAKKDEEVGICIRQEYTDLGFSDEEWTALQAFRVAPGGARYPYGVGKRQDALVETPHQVLRQALRRAIDVCENA